MKSTLPRALLLMVFAAGAASSGFAVSKEIIQMQQQLDTLQQAVANMQKTVDTQSAIIKTLVEQANDNVNSMKATIADLERTNSQNLATSNSRFDSMTNQIQALSAGLEEANSQLSKLGDQLKQTQNIIQTLNTQPAAQPNGAAGTTPGGTPAGPNGGPDVNTPNAANGPGNGVYAPTGYPTAPARQPLPDPDTLYQSGLRDYTAGHYDLAVQEFQQYIQYYGNTDLASNAQFYIGDSYYNQRKYDQAIDEYNKCLERYPNGNKLPAAQLKKAYALIAEGKHQAGVRELRSLVSRFPHSHEAELARQRLRKLT
ncbi:MAG TPA: tol-pal system protein YbgF [Terriglobia bacterium]|nr:tol-pal system protein YbgF [Terriglobia bacterium]